MRVLQYSRRESGLRRAAISSLCLALCACSARNGSTNSAGSYADGPRASAASQPAPSGGQDDVALEPYPRGRWRLLSFEQREHVVLWLSHILVLHQESDPLEMPFLRSDEWAPDAKSTRSVAAAGQLAAKIAAEAQAKPDSFAELARRYSEDVVTRDQGGSLGGLRAGQIPAVFLDAVAELRPGQVSRPIATALGYHVLLLRAPPEDEQVAGQRIVIRYAGTSGVGRPPARTREQALKVALELARQAATADFAELARSHSDAQDAERGGDLGVWSTRDPGYNGREIEALAGLPIGAVSAPLDTVIGYQVLKRIEPDQRATYAAAMLQLPYEADAVPGSETARDAVASLATRLVEQLSAQPAAFDQLRSKYCCAEPERWELGQGPVRIERVTQQLELEQLHLVPVDTGEALVIVKRIAPEGVAAPAALEYQLPKPAAPDFDGMIAASEGPGLARGIRELATDLRKNMHLADDQDREVARVMEELAATIEKSTDPKSRLAHTDAARRALAAKLDPTTYQHCKRFIDAWSSSRLLTTPML